jgi:pimeloyl-ACP methyl ester carboxylesterase
MFSQATFKTIEGAGHWVQADQPERFCNSLIEFAKN